LPLFSSFEIFFASQSDILFARTEVWSYNYRGPIITIRKEVTALTRLNVATEIKKAEEDAKNLVQEARGEARKIVASAKAQAEEMEKTARQEARLHYRNSIQQAETQAEGTAKNILGKGKKEAEAFVSQNASRVGAVAKWIAEEVMTRYDGSRSK
jgi:ATP synthase H subunit